jgi:hypothetical protein
LAAALFVIEQLSLLAISFHPRGASAANGHRSVNFDLYQLRISGMLWKITNLFARF